MKRLNKIFTRKLITALLILCFAISIEINLLSFKPIPANATGKLSNERIAHFSVKDNAAKLIQIYHEVDKVEVKRQVLDLLKEKMSMQESNQEEIINFFWSVAQDRELALAQDALISLVQHGANDALAHLAQNLENNKLAKYPDEMYVTLPWQISREIALKYPQSFLAKGIQDYESISGDSFFNLQSNGLERNYRDTPHEPELEITQWQEWLKKYPGHIASSSVAYRLGQSYEVLGEYPNALNWLFVAVNSSSGDMSSEAYGRFMYILDIKMSVLNLQAALNSPQLDQEIRPMVEYTLALKLARLGQYQEAVERFQVFVKEYNNKAALDLASTVTLPSNETRDSWDFWGKVREQQASLTELSAYAKQIAEIPQAEESAPLIYRTASMIYHDTYIFYNHFWLGNRVHYNLLGHVNEMTTQPSVMEEMQNFIKEQNNYYQALQIFKQLKSIPLAPDLAEKVDFSIALSYAHLEYFGQEIDVLWTDEEQKKLVVDSFNNYFKQYPEGNYREEAIKAISAYVKIGNRPSYLK